MTGAVLVTVSGVASNAQTFTVGTPGPTVYYYIEDILGSSRTIVQDGATAPCYDADFYPFGGERVIANACPQNYKFEGKERDAETGNDDFGARYYSSRFGRWLSADWSAVPAPVPYANLTNPQTLNLYAMVSDSPETFADLDGHGPEGSQGSSTNTPCHDTSNLCNQDQQNHDQNAAQQQKDKSDKKHDDKKSCDKACQLRRQAAWVKLIADTAMFAAALAGGEGETGAEGLEAEYVELENEAAAAEAEAGAKGAADGKITGFTKHGINQAISKDGVGVSGRAMLDAVKNPTQVIQQSGGRTMYVGKDATVITNNEGKVITTWANGSAGTRIP